MTMRDYLGCWIVTALALCLTDCSPDAGPKVGGETHWLALCSRDSDCGADGLSCVCNTCTRVCSGDEACGSGQCYDPRSPLLRERCEEHSVGDSSGVCLAKCETDPDCGSRRSCVQGACVPDGTAGDAVSIDDFRGVSDEVSWETPVTSIPPVDAIEGATDAILGTWTDMGCRPEDPPTHTIWGCVTVVIERSADGRVRGRVRFDRTERAFGPFAPPTDPSVGYPREVTPEDYASLADNLQPKTDYRLYDAKVSDSRLTFDWNRFDPWAAWCELQQPYRWQVAGRAFYFCVPQAPAEQANFDEGKIVLCRSADFEPLCTEAGAMIPCPCTEPVQPRCSGSICECSSEGCHVSPPDGGLRGEIQFFEDRTSAALVLRGTGIGSSEISLRKESR